MRHSFSLPSLGHSLDADLICQAGDVEAMRKKLTLLNPCPIYYGETRSPSQLLSNKYSGHVFLQTSTFMAFCKLPHGFCGNVWTFANTLTWSISVKRIISCVQQNSKAFVARIFPLAYLLVGNRLGSKPVRPCFAPPLNGWYSVGCILNMFNGPKFQHTHTHPRMRAVMQPFLVQGKLLETPLLGSVCELRGSWLQPFQIGKLRVPTRTHRTRASPKLRAPF